MGIQGELSPYLRLRHSGEQRAQPGNGRLASGKGRLQALKERLARLDHLVADGDEAVRPRLQHVPRERRRHLAVEPYHTRGLPTRRQPGHAPLTRRVLEAAGSARLDDHKERPLSPPS